VRSTFCRKRCGTRQRRGTTIANGCHEPADPLQGKTMPATNAASTRNASAARTQVLKDLKDDHKRVKKAYKEFEKLETKGAAAPRKAVV
jgi:hypothetical protein